LLLSNDIYADIDTNINIYADIDTDMNIVTFKGHWEYVIGSMQLTTQVL
jgi:hypothetical protein